MILVEEWIKDTRESRTAHLDLSEACIERGGNSTVHRGVLAEYLNTNFPSKIDLCHACGNDKCSNPRHLYWGTRSENVQDSIMHGTHANPFLNLVKKHGEEEARSIMRKRASIGASAGGRTNKNKPKSEEHKRKISNTLKNKSGRGETGETQLT